MHNILLLCDVRGCKRLWSSTYKQVMWYLWRGSINENKVRRKWWWDEVHHDRHTIYSSEHYAVQCVIHAVQKSVDFFTWLLSLHRNEVANKSSLIWNEWMNEMNHVQHSFYQCILIHSPQVFILHSLYLFLYNRFSLHVHRELIHPLHHTSHQY